jgi:AhpD family alkylhydroperoxidase
MHTDRGFTDLTEDTAPIAAKPIVAATRKHFGFVPSALARMVAAPLLARAFQNAIATFDQASLTETEREVAVLTMARIVACDVCVKLHHAALSRIASPIADRVRDGVALGDARLDALTGFVANVLQTRGDVDDETWSAFLDAGFTRAQALEVVLGIGAYTMSMYANRLTAARVDV